MMIVHSDSAGVVPKVKFSQRKDNKTTIAMHVDILFFTCMRRYAASRFFYCDKFLRPFEVHGCNHVADPEEAESVEAHMHGVSQ